MSKILGLNKWAITTAGLVVVVALIASIGGTFLLREIRQNEGLQVDLEDAGQENQQLTAQNQGLQADLDYAGQENRQVTAQNAGLQSDLDGAGQENQQLTAQNQGLQMDLEDAGQENQQLTTHNEGLQMDLEDAGQENQQLTTHNEGLQVDLEDAGQENQQLTTHNEGLQVDLEDAGQENQQLTTQNEGLQVDLEDAGQENQQLTTQNEGLQADLQVTEDRYQELENQAGTIERLNDVEKTLIAEIAELHRKRQPLVIRSGMGGFFCTGSMEPNLTCLDTVTWLSNYRPEDIIVGSTISFNPNCWEEQANGIGAAHRVLDIKVEDGIYYYWPKGDGNEVPDGCWVPHTAVDGYIIALHQNTRPENAQLRDAVNAAKAEYIVAETAYLDYVEKRCGHRTPGNCTLSSSRYVVATRLWRVLNQAYDYMQCWYKNAKDSEYPGHIPSACV